MPRSNIQEEPVKRSWIKSIPGDDHHSAARLYLQAKRDANDKSLPPGAQQEARHTMHAVVERFPDAPRVAAEAADHELGIEHHTELKGVRDQHRADRGVSASDAARRRRGGHNGTSGTPQGRRGPQGARTRPQRPSTRTARPSRGRRGGGLWGNRYVAQTGIPGATRSATAFALQMLGVMIGLSLTYLLLARAAEGGGFQFLEQGLGSVTAGVRNFVAVVDPLAPRAAGTKAAPVDRTPGAPSQAPRRIAGQIPGLGSTPAARPNRRPTVGQLVPGVGSTVPSK